MENHKESISEVPVSECWAQDFAQRIALAEPRDTVRGIFCNGLLRLVRSLGEEELARRCQEEAGEAKFLDFFSYSVGTYLRMLSTALPLLAARQGGVEQALRYLGRQAVVDMGQSPAGRSISLVNGTEPRRLLENLSLTYQVAVSYGEHSLVWTGPASAHFVLKRSFMPYPFHEGLMMLLLGRLKLSEVRVHGRKTGALDSEYDISWS